ncbi:flagellar export protein FliJ [Paenibacillus rhizovicinus]|uniref:Flagellar FliJ protein n=1 Tax=Paenibacillus rhizovicinus TaxID=2704463 RepID=A0A6C0NV54_9BACL|nr:flagellar export protein FliJ [Paenibacillus rhizovicinus]QHW30067.1 flagellar export protein FliJ [Paenibacillus rhizovicinus]
MTRFHYAYQKIVDLKTSEKSQAEWQLSVVVGKLNQEEASLQQLQAERAAWCDRLQNASLHAVTLSEITMIQSYIDFVDESIMRKLRDVKKAKSAVDEGRQFLSSRMMDEKVWLKTRENALQRFKADMMVKEQNALDELTTSRFMYAAH